MKMPSADYARRALEDLDAILEALKNDAVTFLMPGLLYNCHHYEGMMFQVVLENNDNNVKQVDLLATGGRYDGLVCNT